MFNAESVDILRHKNGIFKVHLSNPRETFSWTEQHSFDIFQPQNSDRLVSLINTQDSN